MKQLSCFLLILLLLTACHKIEPATTPINPNSTAEMAGSADTVVAETDPDPTATQPPLREPVTAMQPLNGAVFETTIIPLSWQASPAASGYRLQLAKSQDFSNLHLETSLSVPQKFTGPLPDGEYFWRVQAVYPDGISSDFSPVQTFSVQRAGDISEPDENLYLDVPHLYQQKDSAMLLLESTHESGTHAWNHPHTGYDASDPACSANSALASIAMLNRFYGGTLTQDRLGYEIFKDRQPGPEFDLPYGTAPTREEITRLLGFALGGEQNCFVSPAGSQPDPVEMTAWVVQQIKEGSPVLADVSGHYVVLNGYQSIEQEELFWVLDPAAGIYRVKNGQVNWSSACVITNVQAAHLEETLLSDSDNDGVLDFDEIERFKTDPFKADSDRDGVRDGDEIRASVFDAQYGYSFTHLPFARDPDLDGLPPELDIDTDGGGCLDGYEDTNLNGLYEPGSGETSVFNPQDDRCYTLKMTWSFDDDWGQSSAEWVGSFSIDSQAKISGRGVLQLQHTGGCIQSELLTAFRIDGKYQDDLQIGIRFENEYETGVYSTEEIQEGCTLGQAVAENWAVSYGIYNGMPPVFISPLPDANAQSEIWMTTPEGAARTAIIHLTIQRIGE